MRELLLLAPTHAHENESSREKLFPNQAKDKARKGKRRESQKDKRKEARNKRQGID